MLFEMIFMFNNMMNEAKAVTRTVADYVCEYVEKNNVRKEAEIELKDILDLDGDEKVYFDSYLTDDDEHYRLIILTDNGDAGYYRSEEIDYDTYEGYHIINDVIDVCERLHKFGDDWYVAYDNRLYVSCDNRQSYYTIEYYINTCFGEMGVLY